MSLKNPVTPPGIDPGTVRLMQYTDVKITGKEMENMRIQKQSQSETTFVFCEVTSCSLVKNKALSKGLTATIIWIGP